MQSILIIMQTNSDKKHFIPVLSPRNRIRKVNESSLKGALVFIMRNLIPHTSQQTFTMAKDERHLQRNFSACSVLLLAFCGSFAHASHYVSVLIIWHGNYVFGTHCDNKQIAKRDCKYCLWLQLQKNEWWTKKPSAAWNGFVIIHWLDRTAASGS